MNQEAQVWLKIVMNCLILGLHFTEYPLNEHAKAMLGLVPEFLEPVWEDVSTDVDKRRTMSDSESDSGKEEGEPLAIEGTAVNDGTDE
ncbi:hypothetical protein H5410_026719 [Solanum commersonii]|uniref:Uncharacterized protein n=1 Tax=Solanum commersonii TaxID=4109 RepID=A0A9J5YWX8_SOLCO|nr:hypothetical protein H5410_026719 [Solanum commersonii]